MFSRVASSYKAQGEGFVVVVAVCQTHSGALTLGSAPAYRWTVGWLPHTGCSSLLYIPCCIHFLKHWVLGSCDHSSILPQTPDLHTCSLWRKDETQRRGCWIITTPLSLVKMTEISWGLLSVIRCVTHPLHGTNLLGCHSKPNLLVWLHAVARHQCVCFY